MTVMQELEIAQLKRELDELRNLPIIADFAKRVGDNLMTLLASCPIDRWPQLALIALDHERRKTPTSAAMYLARLPTG